MKASIFTFPGKEQSYFQIIEESKTIGFDSIELYNTCELSTANVESALRIGEHAQKLGIAVSCLSVGANLSREDNKSEVERLKRYVDVAKAAGSPYLHHTLVPVLNHGFEAVPFSTLLKRLIEAENEICDYAAATGIMILNENQGFCMNGTERFDMFISGLNHKNHGLVADTGNILFVGDQPEKFIGRFAPFIKHVHVKDYLLKQGSDPFPGHEWYITRDGDFLLNTVIGHGVINFEKLFRILIAAGYDGYYSMECGGVNATEQMLKMGLRNMNVYYDNAIRTKKV